MELEIPDSRREKEVLVEHENEQARHRETITANEDHPRDSEAARAEHKEHYAKDWKVGYEEHGERRREDEENVDIKEEYNTMFEKEEQQ